MCLGLGQPFGQAHSSKRVRLGFDTDFVLGLRWTLKVWMMRQ